MIKEFVQAWELNKKNLQKDFEKENPETYKEIVEKTVKVVINPYIKSKNFEYPLNEGLNIDRMTVIDDGEYQGTQLFIIPFDCYQPDVGQYVMTHDYYGSCSQCDSIQRIEYLPEQEKIKAFMTLALHIIQRFVYLNEEEEADN